MKDRALKLIGWAGVLNFVAFLASIVLLGGDALGGKIVQGRYYLGNHGTYTEVSHAIFIYSACHAYSALFGLALAGLVGIAWKRRHPA